MNIDGLDKAQGNYDGQDGSDKAQDDFDAYWGDLSNEELLELAIEYISRNKNAHCLVTDSELFVEWLKGRFQA